MTGEIRRRDEEIRGWNRELQPRVEERTAELKTRAGPDPAHPPARRARLARRRARARAQQPDDRHHGLPRHPEEAARPAAPHGEMIARAQEQAARVARVVEDLRSFADQERAQQGQRFSLARPVRAALALYEDRLRAAGIDVDTRGRRARCPTRRATPSRSSRWSRTSSRTPSTPCREGGTLEVSLGAVDGDALRLRIADTGQGHPGRASASGSSTRSSPRRSRPGRVGLGLSVSHSIVEAHHGRILVESEEGRGRRDHGAPPRGHRGAPRVDGSPHGTEARRHGADSERSTRSCSRRGCCTS